MAANGRCGWSLAAILTRVGQAMGPIQVGDVATWVGGLATAAAMFLTWGLLVITRREQRAARDEKRQAQARLVSGWSDHIQQVSNTPQHSVTVKLQNSSDEPIYGMRAAVGARWSGPGTPYTELDLDYVMPPKSCQEQTVSLHVGQTATGDYEPSPPVELIFSDAAQRFWHRDRFGTLIQITKRLPPSGAEHFFKTPSA